jgi:hypothetical protein
MRRAKNRSDKPLTTRACQGVSPTDSNQPSRQATADTLPQGNRLFWSANWLTSRKSRQPAPLIG